jgi:hypothetical protein
LITSPPEHELTQLHWFNIPGMSNRAETDANLFMKQVRNSSGLAPHVPVFVYMGNGELTGLKNISHSIDDISIMNNLGLHFFLYEPICSRKEQYHHNRGFYSEFPFETNVQEMRADELESIKEYITRNGLKKVIVNTCDYKAAHYHPHYTKMMKLVTNDLFLKNYSLFESFPNNKFTKKFICVNWRYTKHRHLITAFLSTVSSNYSWYFNCNNQAFSHDLFFPLHQWKKTNKELYDQLNSGLEILNYHSPVCLDIKAKASVEITDNTASHYPVTDDYTIYETPAINNPRLNPLENFYNDSFCDVINETRFAQHCGNYSEKLYQAIRYKRPFILVAPPHTIEYAKRMGFKTFSDFWDESYDQETNHEKRIIKILNLINYINSKSINELREIYNQMQEVLDHNYHCLLEKTTFKTVQRLEK